MQSLLLHCDVIHLNSDSEEELLDETTLDEGKAAFLGKTCGLDVVAVVYFNDGSYKYAVF